MENCDLPRGPWHPGTPDQKPYRFGWYEVKIKCEFGGYAVVDRFYGLGGWRYTEANPFKCLIQNLPWRGLAAEPK